MRSMLTAVNLAGIPVCDQDVLELARLLREDGFGSTAERVENATTDKFRCSDSRSQSSR